MNLCIIVQLQSMFVKTHLLQLTGYHLCLQVYVPLHLIWISVNVCACSGLMLTRPNKNALTILNVKSFNDSVSILQ